MIKNTKTMAVLYLTFICVSAVVQSEVMIT
jgi:hypothetical protein